MLHDITAKIKHDGVRTYKYIQLNNRIYITIYYIALICAYSMCSYFIYGITCIYVICTT